MLVLREVHGGAYGVVVTFTGWPVEAVEFFEGLEDDNSRTYWQANKAVYERAVKGPMEALLAELEPTTSGRARSSAPTATCASAPTRRRTS